MVKLATAREIRMYGSRRSRERSEYMNAGLYMFSTIVLLCGFVAQFSREAKSGLVVLLIGLGLIIVVNIHDLVAHLAGINYRFRLIEVDTQLLFVEIAVPVVQALGGLLFFIAILLLVLQADWNVQILQHSVQIPFLMGSLLFLAGAIANFLEQAGQNHHGLNLLTCRWVWIGIMASSFLMIGGLTNIVKVVKMLQMEGIKLEKLRGGAQEQLIEEGDGHTPFLTQRRRPPRILLDEGPPPAAAQI